MDGTEVLSLKINQLTQIVDQYRVNIFNLELRNALLVKMLEEKGLFAREEFDKRWPLYLKNDVGILGPEGTMEGTMKVTFYNGGSN